MITRGLDTNIEFRERIEYRNKMVEKYEKNRNYIQKELSKHNYSGEIGWSIFKDLLKELQYTEDMLVYYKFHYLM